MVSIDNILKQTVSKTTEACKVTQKARIVFKPHDKIPMFSGNTLKFCGRELRVTVVVVRRTHLDIPYPTNPMSNAFGKCRVKMLVI